MPSAWLQAASADADTLAPGQRLQTLLERPGIVKIPGAHDALSGLLAQQAGFEAMDSHIVLSRIPEPPGA